LPAPLETQKPFRPYGHALTVMLSKDPEILFEGPAGTGKSRAVLEKINLVAHRYPGMRGLICRKTRKSITQSVQVTFETKVLTSQPPVRLHRQDQEYRYPNGSRIVVAGMNDPEKIKSTEYDFIYVNEGTEVSQDEYEILTTRNRNGVMPYQQIIVDANPDAPKHWLNLRADTSAMVRLLSKHEDNPSITEAYLSKLDQLTGVRYKRLRLGLWVAAEGMVYENWDHDQHVVKSNFHIPRAWKRWIAVDFGYTNPFVSQWWAQDPESGALYLYREIYHTKRLVQDHAHDMFELSLQEKIEAVITDHDAEDRATLSAHWHARHQCPGDGLSHVSTTAADKDVSTGLEMVNARISANSLFIVRDSLVELDHELKEAGLPTDTVSEIEGYVWDTTVNEKLGIIHKEHPQKRNDHGMDAMRYLVKHIDTGVAAAWAALLGNKNKNTISLGNSNSQKLTELDAWRKMFGHRG
jgi:PBSX family phage terminase large subunit